jgi:protein-disulfide isomerase
MHKDARRAANAARCAHDQGKYWEFQDLLYASQGKMTDERMIEFARELGLKTDAFALCLQEERYRLQVEKDIEDARQLGIDGTPTFFINGIRFTGGVGIDRFKGWLEDAFERAGVKAEKKVSA